MYVWIYKRHIKGIKIIEKVVLILVSFKNKVIGLSKKHTLLIIPLVLYIFFEVMLVMPLPTIGIHAWNEAIYLSLSNYLLKSADPFIFKVAYDPFRPDYNVGYLFYWASYIFNSIIEIFHTYTLESFLWFSRFFSLISTIISSLLIYIISIKLFKRLYCAYLNVIIFLFSPLVLYFGAKFQLEPFTIFVFLLSWLLIILYTETTKIRYCILGFVLLGALVLTRQIFAIYAPALFFTLLTERSTQQKDRKKILGYAVLALVLGFVIPLAFTQAIIPEYSPIKFLYSRLVDSPRMAFSRPWQTGNWVLLYLEKSLLPSLGLSFLFVPIFFFLLLFCKKRFKIFHFSLAAFFIGGTIYFIFAFLHNIVHMYHNYYFIPLVILASGIVTAFVLKINQKILVNGIIILIFISSMFSIWITTSFYGIGSYEIYRDIDGFGNLDSVFASYLINKLYYTSQSNGLLDEGITYYSLVQSPVVYFYTEMPCFSYRDFFIWNTTSQDYMSFNFFIDQESFLQALKERAIFILTITPDVYAKKNQSFWGFIQNNFVFVASEGVYTFYLNQTLFNRAFAFYKNQTSLILRDFEKGQIAPRQLSQYVINMSSWYRISRVSKPNSNGVILNRYQQTYVINSNEINNRALTIELLLTTKLLTNWVNIISIDDVVNVRYGASNDVYLELASTINGYRWFGVNIERFLGENLILTFVYDSDAQRAEIYFNGVLMPSTFKGVNGTSFSSIQLAKTHFIRIASTCNVTDLYSVKLWNRALSTDEVKNLGASNIGLIFSLP